MADDSLRKGETAKKKMGGSGLREGLINFELWGKAKAEEWSWESRKSMTQTVIVIESTERKETLLKRV